MANRNAYRRKWLRWQKTYEKRAYKELNKVFKTWAESIDWSLINSSNYEDEIGKSFDIQLLNDAYLKIYTDIGLVHGERVGKGINLQLKVFSPGDFLTSYMDNILRYLKTFAGKRIVTVRKSFIKYIVDVIRDEFFRDYDLYDTTDNILDVVDHPERIVNGPKFYRWQAERIARTESVGAANYAALEAAEVSGYVMVKEWISAHDKRTRNHDKGDLYDHVEMDRKRVPLRGEFVFNEGDDKLQFPGDPTGEPGNVINCYLPDTIISSNITNGQKAWYSGNVVKIITSRGEILTITPNHGILTKQGFIKAKDLQIGDNLICNKVNTNPIFRLVNNYIKKKLFTVSNIFSSLNKFWSSEQIMVIGLDFDTDGKSMDGNINIVYPEIKLRNSLISSLIKYVNKFQFKTSDPQRVMISRNSPFDFFGSSYKSTFRRLMSFLYLAFPGLFRHFRPFNSFGFGLASHLNAKRFKMPHEGNPDNPGFLRELIETDAGLIAFDKVIYIGNENFTGHVYDFKSVNGVNITNNIYTSNCRCTVAPIPARDINGNLISNE